MESKEFFVKYGDRTSSLLSLYPHFTSFTHEDHEGEIRYIEKSGVVGMANEPLCSEEQKLNFIKCLLTAPEFAKRDKLIFPVSKSLATDLKKEGMFVWQIGIEPIFNLNEYFGRNKDPLEYSPIARSLKKRRGVKVMALNEADIEQYKNDIQELTEEALSQKKMAPLEFLNVIDPQVLEEYKRYFILRDRDMTVAVLTASPVYLNHQIVGYFFNDILKRRLARSASCDLLIIEAMRTLYEEGILEVRLGMCPLAEIAPEERNSKELGRIYSKWTLGYNFKNLYSFKMKLMPTSTRPLYLASDKPQLGRMLRNVYKLHSSKGFAKEVTKRFWFQYKNNLELSQFTKGFARLTKDKGLSLIYRVKWTLSFFAFYVSLHAFKVFTEVGEEFYDLSAYIPGDVTLAGIFAGPMFHNHAYHIIGDQLSFLVFAGALEFTFGAFFMLMIKAIGLWLSNPVTHLFLALTLKYVSPFWWEQVLSEKDWGTSNAVFALVGACLFVLKKSTWLYLPFIFHAIFICFQRESFLAIHHITGLTLGYMFAAFYFAYKIKSEGLISHRKPF